VDYVPGVKVLVCDWLDVFTLQDFVGLGRAQRSILIKGYPIPGTGGEQRSQCGGRLAMELMRASGSQK
jgi:hypothetical protein